MMDKDLQKQLTDAGRKFMKYSSMECYDDVFESDQELKRPQPPLVKEAMRPAEDAIELPRNFHDLPLQNDFIEIVKNRKSSRVYTEEPHTLLELSFLLWATQGIKDIRGKSYATIRTVPAGGARHGFETYLAVRNIEGLQPGRYHYLPMGHALEYLGPIENMEDTISRSLCEQRFGARANVVFYWSFVPYRCEWRYGIYAHRVALIDAGHLCQNLYLACSALGLGTCGIAAFDEKLCNKLFELDGEDEFMVYTATVGSISEKDRAEEQAFYSFVEEQGL